MVSRQQTKTESKNEQIKNYMYSLHKFANNIGYQMRKIEEKTLLPIAHCPLSFVYSIGNWNSLNLTVFLASLAHFGLYSVLDVPSIGRMDI